MQDLSVSSAYASIQVHSLCFYFQFKYVPLKLDNIIRHRIYVARTTGLNGRIIKISVAKNDHDLTVCLNIPYTPSLIDCFPSCPLKRLLRPTVSHFYAVDIRTPPSESCAHLCYRGVN